MSSSLIYNLSFAELTSLLASWGEDIYRARQIWQGLYKTFWNTPQEFINLPVKLREKLFDNLEFKILNPVAILQSSDGETSKFLFQLHDKLTIETVLMKYPFSKAIQYPYLKNVVQGRRTVCISTQVGCAMGCVFCATGQMGFRRHLSNGEIAAQVLFFARQLREQGEKVTNVVVMGMGEPFHNYDNTMTAIDKLNDPDGYNFGARRFTVSTVGLVPAIQRFTSEKRQVNLAISLHAADDKLRTSMLPVNNRYPLDILLESCRDYGTVTRRRVSFEWALVNGVNDTSQQASLLASKLHGIICHVNAIPLNPTVGFSGKATTRQQSREFKETLTSLGVPCTIRLRRGMDIQAGCGQLIT
jgi:23S rRNA (adenine2503-C2)-methyltransferase